MWYICYFKYVFVFCWIINEFLWISQYNIVQYCSKSFQSISIYFIMCVHLGVVEYLCVLVCIVDWVVVSCWVKLHMYWSVVCDCGPSGKGFVPSQHCLCDGGEVRITKLGSVKPLGWPISDYLSKPNTVSLYLTSFQFISECTYYLLMNIWDDMCHARVISVSFWYKSL